MVDLLFGVMGHGVYLSMGSGVRWFMRLISPIAAQFYSLFSLLLPSLTGHLYASTRAVSPSPLALLLKVKSVLCPRNYTYMLIPVTFFAA